MSRPTPSRVPTALLLVPLCGALALSACGKDPEQAPPSGERSKEPVPETPKDAPSGPFAEFDFDDAAKRWQGAWVLPGSAPGTRVAWSIEGERLIEFDGQTEKTYAFAVYSPCQITYTDADAGVTTYQSFTFDGDTLHAGLGAAGTMVDGVVMACIAGKTYVLRGDLCLEWSEMFDDWKSTKSDCRLSGEGTGRKLVTADGEIPLLSATSTSGALADAQMFANTATWHADFAAAKAALAGGEAP